jgi:hypothetical protein
MIGALSVHDRCTMVLLGVEAQVEARFGPFRDNANHDTR